MKMNRRNFLKVAAILGGGAFASIFKLGNVWACEKTAVTESIFIPAQILEDMKQHARELAPQECCGILGGQECNVSEQYRITNVLATMTDQELSRFEGAKLSDLKQLPPEERMEIAFQMDVREMALAQRDLRSQGLSVVGFYHSHTFSPARPSHTDITIAMEFERYRTQLNLPEPFHLVISLEDPTEPDIRAFRIRNFQTKEATIIRI